MTQSCRGRALMFRLAALVAVALAVPAAAFDTPREYLELVRHWSPALVTIKFVLKIRAQSESFESENEITGVMIDPEGLVLCANTQLGSPRFLRGVGSATPTSIKILIGEDTEGLKAKVLARDTELDLAWVKLDEKPTSKLAYVDLRAGVKPELGDRLLFLRKMAKYFDRSTTISEGRVSGRTSKPRDLIVPTRELNLEPGLPVFDGAGKVVGVVVIQMPDEEEMEANRLAFMGIGRDIGGGMILPAAEVLKATRRAQQTIREQDDDEAGGDSAQSGDGDAHDRPNPTEKEESPGDE
jgi:S1-C subfamily serine protease